MYCLSKMCYVCLKQANNLITINSSYADKAKFSSILNYFAFNLSWLLTNNNILVCEECCCSLQVTYQFLQMCRENSAVLQGYVSTLAYSLHPNKHSDANINVALVDINKVHDTVKENEEPQQITQQDQELFPIAEKYICKEEIVKEQEDIQFGNYCENKTNELLPYNCSLCPASYTVETYLNTHMQIHNDTKQYKCLVCNLSCITKSVLTVHLRSHTGEKPYKCAVCGVRFSLKSNLDRHNRTHTGEKLYKCLACHTHFSLLANLKRHMRTHTRENTLASRSTKHTQNELYKCSEFNTCFRMDQVQTHMLTDLKNTINHIS